MASARSPAFSGHQAVSAANAHEAVAIMSAHTTALIGPPLRRRPGPRVPECWDASHFDDDVLILHGHREGLGDVGTLDQACAGLDRDREMTHPHAARVDPGFARADVILPLMPRASQDFPVTRGAVLARFGRFDEAGQDSLRKIPALMRAATGQREKLAREVEDHDGAALHLDELAEIG